MAATLGLGNRVTFLGDRRDVSAILASADVSVLPSISESLSNAIMESMAAGVPVVACRIGGNEELIRDGESGFLVLAGSDEDLAARVESLVDQPGLRKSFGAAAKRNAQNFSVEKICEQYERLYMSLLEEKGMGQAVLAKSALERGV
jgi:glycosyltransferase involved in cell wall biosynthesis